MASSYAINALERYCISSRLITGSTEIFTRKCDAISSQIKWLFEISDPKKHGSNYSVKHYLSKQSVSEAYHKDGMYRYFVHLCPACFGVIISYKF